MALERVLLFGAGGQLGSAFREQWPGLIAPSRAQADLSVPGTAAACITAACATVAAAVAVLCFA